MENKTTQIDFYKVEYGIVCRVERKGMVAERMIGVDKCASRSFCDHLRTAILDCGGALALNEQEMRMLIQEANIITEPFARRAEEVWVNRESLHWDMLESWMLKGWREKEEAKIKAMELEKAFDESVAAMDEKDRENCGWAPSFSVIKIVEDMGI